MPTKTLNKAIEVIEARDKTHGDFRENFEHCAAMWSAYLGTDIAPAQVGIMMAMLKISRDEVGGKHPDHLLDAVGYIALADAVGK